MNRRQAAAALGSVSLTPLGFGQPGKSPADLDVEAFFQRPQFVQAELNPSGTWVAMTMAGQTGRRRLAVVDLATLKSRVIAVFDQVDVDSFHWVSDTRLVFQVNDDENGAFPRSWYGVDADGERFKLLRRGGSLVRQGPLGGDHVLIQRADDFSEGPGFLKLSRLNVRNGTESELDVPPWSIGFLIDPQGEPVAALTVRGDRARLLWREGKEWRVVRETERFYGDSFSLLAMGPDRTVYVTARHGSDLSALYTYSPSSNSLSNKPLLALEQFDVEPQRLVFGPDKLLGARVHADAWTTVWFDDGMKALQAKIDSKLPDTANLISAPQQGTSPWVLVWAWSDRQPAMAVLYNRQTDKLTLLGRSMPQIDPALMSSMDFTSYKARDGRTIPAYLTLPRVAGNARPLPMVVLVHGGPFVRGGSWQWNAQVQFLASRGYAVLQPEYRGSTGFGESHFKAGWRQWGQAMQDDLADGVHWAVAQGVADPKRVAIAGASYGGYAAMMGLAKQADLFTCAINWVGVTDLDLMYGAFWSDFSNVVKQHGLPKVLGDRQADAQMLRDNSPLHLADRIRKPVLMAYGRLDLRVPRQHGERMRDALKPHNPNVEWVYYDNEGHGWYRPDTNKDFWTRVERFLAKHLVAKA